jgi:hypothetical protein
MCKISLFNPHWFLTLSNFIRKAVHSKSLFGICVWKLIAKPLLKANLRPSPTDKISVLRLNAYLMIQMFTPLAASIF